MLYVCGMAHSDPQPIPQIEAAKPLGKRVTRQYSLHIDTIDLIERLAGHRKVSKTSIIAWAVMDLAVKEGIVGRASS